MALLWSALESGARQLLSFGLSLVILAFLTPHDLGVYSLSFSFVLVLALIVDDPIGEALIQRSSTTIHDWNTGFTINLCLAFAIFLLSFGFCSFIARIFAEPDLRLALPALSICILIGSLGNLQKAYLTQELRFRSIVSISLIANVAGGVFALGLAMYGIGYWSLIANLVLTNVITSTLYWRASPWKPKLKISGASFSALRSFAGQSFAAQCVLQLREGALPIAVGWFGGAQAVGYFSLALRLCRTLGLLFEDMTRRPLFALMSRMHHVNETGAVLLLDVITVVGGVALPAFVGLALVGPILMPLALGSRWSQGGLLIPYFCAIVFGWLTLHVPAVALRARGQPAAAVRLLGIPTLLDLGLIIALLPYGIKAALLAMVARAAVWLVFLGSIMRRTLGVTPRSILRRCILPLAGACAMVPCVALARSLTGDGWLGIAAQSLSGGLAYASVLGLGILFGDRTLIYAIRDMR